MKLTITSNQIKALLLTAGYKDVRAYLNGIAIDTTTAGRCYAVSTDGHRATVINLLCEIEDRTDGVYIIPREMCEAVKAAKGSDVTIGIVGDAVSLAGVTTVSGKLCDGRFPDWRRIVPATVTGETAQFNGEYLGEFYKAAKLLGVNRYGIVPIAHNGSGAALVGLGPDAFGVCMPLRADNAVPLATPPEWLTAVAL